MSGIALLSEFLAMKPFEMAGISCIFPRFEGSPWVLWIISLTGDYGLDKCWFEAFLEQVDGSIIIEHNSSCCSKLFEFRYEDIKALFLSKSSELVESSLLVLVPLPLLTQETGRSMVVPLPSSLADLLPL